MSTASSQENLKNFSVYESELGDYVMTQDDCTEGARFEDAISYTGWHIDIHHPEGKGTTYGHQSENEWYEIPYGCIVPKDIDNLLIGGRSISVDHALHSSMRVMPIVCSIGQAAGVAAAMCLKKHCIPRTLDGVKLRAELREFGANL